MPLTYEKGKVFRSNQSKDCNLEEWLKQPEMRYIDFQKDATEFH